jgi:hypothetical protein
MFSVGASLQGKCPSIALNMAKFLLQDFTNYVSGFSDYFRAVCSGSHSITENPCNLELGLAPEDLLAAISPSGRETYV